MNKNNRTSLGSKLHLSRRTIIVGLVSLVLVATAGWFLLRPDAEDATTEPTLQTSKVRNGDLVITANGAGTVLPLAQVELGFRSSGKLTGLDVTLGEVVSAGQVLARLDGSVQAEADFQAIFTSAGIALTEGKVAEAEAALASAKATLIYLISPNVYYYENKLAEAKAALDALNADPAATEEAKADAQDNVRYAEINLEAAQVQYLDEYCPIYFPYTYVDSDTGAEILGIFPPAATTVAIARADVETALLDLEDAQTALEIALIGPSALTEAIPAIGPQTSRLEQARQALENTRITAPFDGAIVSIDAVLGQSVGTTPILSLATTQELLVRFYLDETDVDKAATGKRVIFTFDAYPDLPLEGNILFVEPALGMVDGIPAVVAWANLPQTSSATILSGMSVDVEVIAGETHDAMLIPVQALRELAPGSFAVFVVQSDGQLVLTPVTIGLRDYANVEIITGLKVGDIVSTGTVETK